MYRSREFLTDKLIISDSINEFSKVTGIDNAYIQFFDEHKYLEAKPLPVERFSLICQNFSNSRHRRTRSSLSICRPRAMGDQTE